MVGSRSTGVTAGMAGTGTVGRSTGIFDDICLDRRYVDSGRVVPKEDQRLDEKLESIIDGEIIPRLMLLHREGERVPQSKAEPMSGDAVATHLDEFTGLILTHDADTAAAYVRVLLQNGADLEALLLRLFAPAARRLGEMWESDEIDFVDVTIGTSRLQQLLHEFTYPPAKAPGGGSRRVLLLPAPSEQHTFGLLMVSDFFRREGWEVWGGSPLSQEDLWTMVAGQWFSVVGFSLSNARLIDALCSTITKVRRLSKNQSVQIIVGGRVIAEDKALALSLGADLAVTDAQEAVRLAKGLAQETGSRRN